MNRLCIHSIAHIFVKSSQKFIRLSLLSFSLSPYPFLFSLFLFILALCLQYNSNKQRTPFFATFRKIFLIKTTYKASQLVFFLWLSLVALLFFHCFPNVMQLELKFSPKLAKSRSVCVCVFSLLFVQSFAAICCILVAVVPSL